VKNKAAIIPIALLILMVTTMIIVYVFAERGDRSAPSAVGGRDPVHWIEDREVAGSCAIVRSAKATAASRSQRQPRKAHG